MPRKKSNKTTGKKKKPSSKKNQIKVPDSMKNQDGVCLIDPKFLTDPNWGKTLTSNRRKSPHKVAKELQDAFKFDSRRGISFVMRKYDLTKEEALSEMKRLVRNFNPDLVRP